MVNAALTILFIYLDLLIRIFILLYVPYKILSRHTTLTERMVLSTVLWLMVFIGIQKSSFMQSSIDWIADYTHLPYQIITFVGFWMGFFCFLCIAYGIHKIYYPKFKEG
jgi:hypothetical protein